MESLGDEATTASDKVQEEWIRIKVSVCGEIDKTKLNRIQEV